MDFTKPWTIELPSNGKKVILNAGSANETLEFHLPPGDNTDLHKEYNIPPDINITFEETDALKTYTSYEILRKWMESCKSYVLTPEQKKQISDNLRAQLPQEVLDLIPADAILYLQSVDFDCPHNENTITVEYAFEMQPHHKIHPKITFDSEDKPEGNLT
jgi:hypothetical protein